MWLGRRGVSRFKLEQSQESFGTHVVFFRCWDFFVDRDVGCGPFKLSKFLMVGFELTWWRDDLALWRFRLATIHTLKVSERKWIAFCPITRSCCLCTSAMLRCNPLLLQHRVCWWFIDSHQPPLLFSVSVHVWSPVRYQIVFRAFLI